MHLLGLKHHILSHPMSCLSRACVSQSALCLHINLRPRKQKGFLLAGKSSPLGGSGCGNLGWRVVRCWGELGSLWVRAVGVLLIYIYLSQDSLVDEVGNGGFLGVGMVDVSGVDVC